MTGGVEAGAESADGGPAASEDGADLEADGVEDALSLTETSLVEVSTSRLRVLKALKGNRCTGSELARELDLNKSTVHGYLQDLVGDGLVDRHDPEDRMWVYYSLSETGQAIVDRDRVRLVVDITTIAALLGSAALGLQRFVFADEPAGGGSGTLATPSGGSEGLPWLTVALGALLVLVVAGLAAGTYLRRAPVDVARTGD